MLHSQIKNCAIVLDNQDWKSFFKIFIFIIQIDILKKLLKKKITCCFDGLDENLKKYNFQFQSSKTIAARSKS